MKIILDESTPQKLRLLIEGDHTVVTAWFQGWSGLKNLQHAALKRAGCKTVFKDEDLSGATTRRPALLRCLKQLQAGETLIVWKLDRLGRSVRDLITNGQCVTLGARSRRASREEVRAPITAARRN